MTEVRTRFAPSPTGNLHIGNFRTALFSWFLAKHHGGQFILRIEDTDQERKVPGSVQYLYDCFKWFGIEIDEGPSLEDLSTVEEDVTGLPDLTGPYGPYIQSKRLHRYKEVADQLIESGHAFRCDCTPEMLEQERNEQIARKEPPGYSGYCRSRNVSAETKHVVRFRMPHKPDLVVQDAVKGRLTWESVPLKDPVLLKSDGFPTYHLAVVVDDHDMEISHVLRAVEWIPSLPLHALIYQALGWEAPIFAHVPHVLGNDGKKLSKRHGSVSWDSFRDSGYLPEALLNFMMLIGWSPGDGEEQEIFSRDELIQRFSLERINSSAGVFDYKKLDWMNGSYVRELSNDDFNMRAKPFMAAAEVRVPEDRWKVIVPSVKERVKTLREVPEMVKFLQEGELERDVAAMFGKKTTKEELQKIFDTTVQELSSLKDFSAESIEKLLHDLPESLGMKVGQVLSAVRIAVTGQRATPPLSDSMIALGKEETLKRLQEGMEAAEEYNISAA